MSPLAGALVEVMAIGVMIALVGVVVIAVVANRADPDPSGRRPQAVYFFVVSFVTITVALTGSALVVGSVLGFTAHHSPTVGHALTHLLLLSTLVTLVAGVLFAVHLRRDLDLARAASPTGNPSTRVGQSYVAVVAFVSILVILVTAIFSIYLVFAIASPGAFGSFGGRGWAIRILIESLYLAVVASFVAWRHSSLLAPGLGIRSGTVGGSGPEHATGEAIYLGTTPRTPWRPPAACGPSRRIRPAPDGRAEWRAVGCAATGAGRPDPPGPPSADFEETYACCWTTGSPS